MKNISQFKSMEIVGKCNTNDVIHQKMLKVMGIANLITECGNRITRHEKEMIEWERLGLGIKLSVYRYELYTNMTKRLKKSYYNALESLQLQVEKEKHTAGYFKK